MRRGPKFALAALAIAATVLLAGCSSDPLAQQYLSGSGKGYIAGSGVTEVAPSHRAAPVDFSGPTAEGGTFTSSAERGKVLVVNFWYADCAPCRSEAKDLEKISRQFADKPVQFIGVNTENQPVTIRTFDQSFGVTYPSIVDVNDGHVQLAFSGDIRPNATPTTLVLDKEGRIASRVEGPIDAQPSTLVSLINSALSGGT
ncbi:MAG TPA: TlpA disulfide reductase family protein [Pseudolysinimonas sp.]|nr:TlpA disulfide reductase family protein [Pseudolysinimonas sp.]